MKKFLLLGAAAMLAGSVNAQTITGKMTLDWEHSMADHSGNETRSIGRKTKQLLTRMMQLHIQWVEAFQLTKPAISL